MESADYRVIERLTYDYAYYNDTFQVDKLVELFVEDATFDMRGVGLGTYEGKAEIRDFFEREKRALSHVMHVTSNHRIDVTGDRAKGTVYYYAVGIVRKGGVENPSRGYYDDRYVRTAKGWLFQSRAGTSLIPWTPVRAGGAT